MMEEVPPIAAVACAEGPAADDALASAAAALRAEGRRVLGHVQRARPGVSRDQVLIEDLASGGLTPITQELGACAAGCALDPAALAAASGALEAALEAPADLLIVNRFGRGEAEGGGLRGAIEKASLAGVPVLVALRPDYAEDWQGFTGGTPHLPPDAAAILAWARAAIAARG